MHRVTLGDFNKVLYTRKAFHSATVAKYLSVFCGCSVECNIAAPLFEMKYMSYCLKRFVLVLFVAVVLSRPSKNYSSEAHHTNLQIRLL